MDTVKKRAEQKTERPHGECCVSSCSFSHTVSCRSESQWAAADGWDRLVYWSCGIVAVKYPDREAHVSKAVKSHVGPCSLYSSKSKSVLVWYLYIVWKVFFGFAWSLKSRHVHMPLFMVERLHKYIIDHWAMNYFTDFVRFVEYNCSTDDSFYYSL